MVVVVVVVTDWAEIPLEQIFYFFFCMKCKLLKGWIHKKVSLVVFFGSSVTLFVVCQYATTFFQTYCCTGVTTTKQSNTKTQKQHTNKNCFYSIYEEYQQYKTKPKKRKQNSTWFEAVVGAVCCIKLFPKKGVPVFGLVVA